jgi:hypothetical protein
VANSELSFCLFSLEALRMLNVSFFLFAVIHGHNTGIEEKDKARRGAGA